MKIAVLTSGGVDSSVTLRLLKDEGHDVTAFYLKIWLEDELSYLGDCPWEEDLNYVQKICSNLNVPLQIVPMQEAYWKRVVEYTVAEAKAGRTPNPDVLCNQQIKFGQFYEVIDDSFEKVATGHYAQIEALETNCNSSLTLKMAPDPVKDQTYFLAQISQAQLSRAMFPIGKYTKEEVRELAKQFDLPNQDRKDSQGICFLGKIPFKEFLRHHLDVKPGDFVNLATGQKVGEHDGFWFYTIGQRQGLGLSGGPWFVVRKDVEKNVVYLVQGYEPREVYRTEFNIGPVHWINEKFVRSAGCKAMDKNLQTQIPDQVRNDKFLHHAPCTTHQLKVKIRHGAVMHDCRVEGNKVYLEKPVHGVAAGQFAVFYAEDICLGSAVIV